MHAKAPGRCSDTELRSELKNLGCDAGPITHTTRGLYLEKLKRLRSTTATGTASCTSASAAVTKQLQTCKKAQVDLQTAQVPRTPKSPSGSPPPTGRPNPLTLSPPPSPLPPLPLSPSSVVTSQLLHSLDSNSHLASDTAFIFPEGNVFLASRAILSTQCPKMTPLLYCREGVCVCVCVRMFVYVYVCSSNTRPFPNYMPKLMGSTLPPPPPPHRPLCREC